jgi:hypothetical protein
MVSPGAVLHGKELPPLCNILRCLASRHENGGCGASETRDLSGLGDVPLARLAA